MKNGRLSRIRERLAESAFVKLKFMDSAPATIERIATALARALKAGRRVWLFGNGGSAADAQHIAAELEGRYSLDRRPWPATALTTNSSTITCIANDWDYATTFPRLVDAHVRKGDVVVAISTSGNSPNVVEGARRARQRGAVVVGFTGAKGGKLASAVDVCLRAPSDVTARIQECHITAGHVVCELLDEMLPR